MAAIFIGFPFELHKSREDMVEVLWGDGIRLLRLVRFFVPGSNENETSDSVPDWFPEHKRNETKMEKKEKSKLGNKKGIKTKKTKNLICQIFMTKTLFKK